MRIFNWLAAALLATSATAWENEDYEIFKLRDDVIADQGPDTTFYSFLGVDRKAKRADIDRAYRKATLTMHPDKAKRTFLKNWSKTKDAAGNVIERTGKPSKKEIDAFTKESAARFARLGVVTNILRGERRDRYDWFLDRGFPKWRGTGYYYQRYRPGATTVLLGLFIVMGGFAHYGALILGWKRQREFAEKYIKNARKMAWGNNMVIPGLDTAAPAATPATSDNGGSALNRRQKRLQEKEDKKKAKNGEANSGLAKDDISHPQEPKLISGPQGSKRRVVAENGKVLIVDSVGNVFVEETSEEGETHEFLIDVNEIRKPTMFDTVLFQLPLWAYHKTAGQFLGSKVAPPALEDHEVINNEEDDHPASNGATAKNAAGEARRRGKANVRKRP